MIAPACRHEHTKRHGRDQHGNQRYRCKGCGKTWIEQHLRPLGNMRLSTGKAVTILKMLLDGGSSIRAAERITGTNRNTVLSLLELVGERARMFWIQRMRDLPAEDVQADECFGFMACKEKTRKRQISASEWAFGG